MLIQQAVQMGIEKIRQPHWNKHAYMKLHIIRVPGMENGYGFWAELYDPPSMYALYGDATKTTTIFLGSADIMHNGDWEEYIELVEFVEENGGE